VLPVVECTHNGKQFFVIDLVVHLGREEFSGVVGNRMKQAFIIKLATCTTYSRNSEYK
jgi:hypothetical protein